MCVDRFWESKLRLYFNFAVMKETHIIFLPFYLNDLTVYLL
jgi:hypothetical protein